jgi:hypothetical protein
MTSHFLFVAGALRERSSRDSADLQLAHQVWGLRSELIRDNVQRYLSAESCGVVYVLKEGLCAHFSIASGVQPLDQLDALVRDELRTEARYGYVAIAEVRRWQSSSEQSLASLKRILEVPDQAELTRRLNLGMHRLTQEQLDALLKAAEAAS